MNRNQTKDPDRTSYGRNPRTNPRDKQRDDTAATKPDPRDEMEVEPVGTPETNRPLNEGKRKPAEQSLKARRQPRDDNNASREPGSSSDAL